MKMKNYEDVSNITVNMKHQKEAKQKQGKIKTQKMTQNHMKECQTLSEVQTAVSHYENQEVYMTRWSHKQNVDTC